MKVLHVLDYLPKGKALAVCLSGLLTSLQAETILVDFQSDNPVLSVAATPADFQAFDPNVDTSAPVNAFTSRVDFETGPIVGASGDEYFATVSPGFIGDFNSAAASWTSDRGILDGYLFKPTGNSAVTTITIDGFSGIAADQIITLTVFGVGDNVAQDSEFTAKYGNLVFEEKETVYGDTRTVPGGQDFPNNAVPAVSWSFSSDGMTDEISIDWVQSAPSTFSNLNGFSITTSDPPTLGDVQSVMLTPETSTVLDFSNPFSLNLQVNFSLAGDLSSELFLDNITYTVDPADIVAVSNSGQVSILGPGVATVTATVTGDAGGGSMSDSVQVTVEEIQSLTVTTESSTLLEEGPSTTASVTASGTTLIDVSVDDFETLAFSEDDPDVLEVIADGTVVPRGPGTTNVIAELVLDGRNPITATAEVTVEAPTEIRIETALTELFINGGDVPLDIIAISPSFPDGVNVNNLVDQIVFLDSSDTAILGQSTNLNVGITAGSTAGTATLTATFEGVNADVIATQDFTVSEVPDRPLELIHRYSFNESAGATTVEDSVNGRNGTVVGDGASFANGQLTVPGAAGGSMDNSAYVDLPNGMISALPKAVTFEIWATSSADNAWERFFDFGDSRTFDNGTLNDEDVVGKGNTYLALIATTGQNDPALSGRLGVSFTIDSNENQSLTFNPDLMLPAEEVHIVLTYDSQVGNAVLYVNGMLEAEAPIPLVGANLSDLRDINNWLGRSQWGGNGRFGGSFNEFRIYRGVMTPDEVTASGTAGVNAAINGVIITPPTAGLTIARAEVVNGNTLEIDFVGGEAGAVYQLNSTPTLQNFQAVAGETVTADGSGNGSFSVTIDPATNPKVFYNVTQQ